jgi:hypothetical protein
LVFLENDSYKLCWDHARLTDKTVHLNRPGITFLDKAKEECAFTDTPIPLTHNLQATATEKPRQYQELAFEISKQWQLNKIIFFPLLLSAMGGIPNTLNLTLTDLNEPPRIPCQVQKVVVINIVLS